MLCTYQENYFNVDKIEGHPRGAQVEVYSIAELNLC